MKIKFRVWDIKNKRFLNRKNEFSLLSNGKLLISDSGWYSEFENANQNNYVVQLFTGQTDKNNKEIYVGDLIKIDNSVLENEYLLDQNNEVIFDFCAFGLKTKDKVGNKQFSHLGNFESKDLEIVGNIFQNPESISK
jgi:uncharacterized phage protein (TIGR01671 family)